MGHDYVSLLKERPPPDRAGESGIIYTRIERERAFAKVCKPILQDMSAPCSVRPNQGRLPDMLRSNLSCLMQKRDWSGPPERPSAFGRGGGGPPGPPGPLSPGPFKRGRHDPASPTARDLDRRPGFFGGRGGGPGPGPGPVRRVPS
eukprot:scaffold380935_cov48-Prasinocladus_malaysianus.AAC.1